MSVKEQKRDFSDIEYRFSFALTINDAENKSEDIIICKRDFNIYNLDEESLYSIELKECIDDVVNIIDRDLKSKSRVYTWYNMPLDFEERNGDGSRHMGVFHGNTDESKDVSSEFTTNIPEKEQTTFKFTLFDNNRAIISKIWSGDEYPFSVRNSVDLTNRKYKYDKGIEMDFAKQVAQKGSAGKPDLTSMIMRHISSTCASYKSRQNGKKLMYKQYIPELNIDNVVIDAESNSVKSFNNRLNHIKIVTDDYGYEKLLYDVYHTKYKIGNKEYSLEPISDIEEE